jgi:hypothetical protein
MTVPSRMKVRPGSLTIEYHYIIQDERSALDIPSGYGSRVKGSALDIPSGYGSQEPEVEEVRMARFW